MAQGILTDIGYERIMSFFDGKELIGETETGKLVYLDRMCSVRYEYSPGWGRDLTPNEFKKSIIVVSNRMEAHIVMAKGRNYWSDEV